MRILRTIGLLTLMMPQVLQAEPSTLKAETKDILLETFQEAVRGNDFDKAEKAATDLIKLETEHPELAYSRRAKVYLAQDKFAEAASDLAEVAKLNPTPSTINDLGSIRYQAGQLREALTDFDPRHQTRTSTRGRALATRYCLLRSRPVGKRPQAIRAVPRR